MAIRPCYPFQEMSWALSHSAALQPQAPVLSASGCQWGENQGKRHIEQFMLSAQKAFDILLHVTLGIFGQYKTTVCKDLDTVPCPRAASPARGACASQVQYNSHSLGHCLWLFFSATPCFSNGARSFKCPSCNFLCQVCFIYTYDG